VLLPCSPGTARRTGSPRRQEKSPNQASFGRIGNKVAQEGPRGRRPAGGDDQYRSQGKIDLRASNAIGFLPGILLKALEKGPVEERLNQLEAIVAGKSRSLMFEFRRPEESAASSRQRRPSESGSGGKMVETFRPLFLPLPGGRVRYPRNPLPYSCHCHRWVQAINSLAPVTSGEGGYSGGSLLSPQAVSQQPD
jgi:hypothetical protein